MSLNVAPQTPSAAPGSVDNHAVSFAAVLDEGELLTGTPTVEEVTTSDLTITNKALNTVALTINNQSVAIGMAVQFRVSGQLVTGSPYTIKITVGTDSTPAQTKVKWIKFVVEET